MKLKILVFIFVSQLVSLSVLAQNDEQVKSVFDLYGKRKGSTMVQLSTDILGSKSRITLYKSLVADNTADVFESISQIVDNEQKTLTEISIVRKNGRTVNGVYLLSETKVSNKTRYEYILYSYGSKLTFVYIQGFFPPEELDNELKKLKELFIYINKSRENNN